MKISSASLLLLGEPKEKHKAATTRAYSADKTLANLLGRSPRIDGKLFSPTVLGYIVQDLTTADISEETWTLAVPNRPTFSYNVDPWQSAMCAKLREKALEPGTNIPFC